MMHQGRVISRTELVEHLYDQDFDRDSNTIEVFVGRLRRKLGVDIIQTMRGLGYLVTADGAKAKDGGPEAGKEAGKDLGKDVSKAGSPGSRSAAATR